MIREEDSNSEIEKVKVEEYIEDDHHHTNHNNNFVSFMPLPGIKHGLFPTRKVTSSTRIANPLKNKNLASKRGSIGNKANRKIQLLTNK